MKRPGGRAAGRLRAVDSSPKTIEAVRKLRRALPGDPTYGDPLSVSGRGGASAVARLSGQLFDTDEPRASRELSMSALQVWTSFGRRGRGERELTLLFTDLVGFSDWALRAGDDDTLALLRAVADAIERPVHAHRGRVVKRLGDGLMATFTRSQDAFEAVTAARAGLAGIEIAGYRPVLRAGLHTGRPRRIGNDLVGVDVNVAARICERADADEVLVSDTACAGLDPEKVRTQRRRTFSWARGKGVPEGLVVYAATPLQPPPA